MSSSTSLAWLPADDQWRARLKVLIGSDAPPAVRWEAAVALANHRMDFAMTNALDAAIRGAFEGSMPDPSIPVIRLALMTSCTAAHLHAALRVAALRRGIWLDVYENAFGGYFQELIDPGSPLARFAPDVLLFALDAHHLAGMADERSGAKAPMAHLRDCWRMARERLGCTVIQQTLLDPFSAVLGQNEPRLPTSRSAIVAALNAAMDGASASGEVDIVALHRRQAIDGIDAWFKPSLWHMAKQEIAPPAAPIYGDMVVRLIAARRGRSFKCLALDLDNTLWGGVVGDDGLDGIKIGQGSAGGEAFVAFQRYALDLARRGVILAVCSKNDEANAREPFEKHPDMLLRSSDIASFVANWDDKATNLRRIASELNIGLDAIVFVDDNPFERALVRRELPMVAVPEVEDDAATFARTLADAGYFEAVAITEDDLARGEQYRQNRERAALLSTATDLEGYLRELDMRLIWQLFDDVGLPRITQLINKTNQFNLTTRRYSEEAVRAVIDDDHALGLQFRLTDRFGDNGIIGVMIGRSDGDAMLIDSWLMSCRVLGRGVEQAMFGVFAQNAAAMGARRLVGEYIPTSKNGMVSGLYARLGFDPASSGEGSESFTRDLGDRPPVIDHIIIEKGQG